MPGRLPGNNRSRRRRSVVAGALLSVFVALATLLVACGGGAATTTTTTNTPTSAPPTTTTAPPTSTPPTSTPPTSAPPTTTGGPPANPDLIMASTTSTRDSGLMDVLIPVFEQKTGYKMKPVYVGSGAAMALGQQGNADVLLVHSPAAEVAFMAGGYGINRRLIMHNDFIIVGQPLDPARISGMTSATAALSTIASLRATFYSRGDNSGTDALEKSLWAKIGITVADNSTTNPKWYIQGGAGTGMLDLLRLVSDKGGYTITDRATFVANQSTLALKIMVQGDPVLLNIYHVIQVNPDKFPKVNAAGAKAFSDFMVDPATQKLIADYGKEKYGQALFFPDAGKTEAELGSQ
jgi:tungstate transport system substrate-binding protein